MRRLLDRFKIAGPGDNATEEREADDEGFFSTQFMERPELSRAASAWTSRALAVGAQGLDPAMGVELLLKAWHDDTFTSLMGEAERDKLRTHLEFVTVPAGRELIVQDEKGDYALFHQWAFHSLLPLATKLTPYFHLSAVAQQNSR